MTYSLMKEFGCERTNYINLQRVSDMGDVTRMTDAAMAEFDAEKVKQTADRTGRRFNAFLGKIAGLISE